MFVDPISDSDALEHAAALAALGRWAHAFELAELGGRARTALDDVLANLLAVAAGGAATAEHAALVAAWDPEPGAATLLGGGTATVETAAWLNGVASVAMERDEGNRLTKGHPASQSFFAVLALAERLGSSGPDTLAALAVAYEVAARFGRATDFATGVHTHGTFGVPGAAAGCARLLGLDAAGITSAIDAACALPPATNWGPVLVGSSVRDQWVGAGNVAGLAAARFAAARPGETVRGTLPRFGGSLGTVDPRLLVAGLGTETLIEHGYFKRHSSCAYTHAPADAALLARERIAAAGATHADIVAVEVSTTAAGAALDATDWTTRHGAYFSVPFAVASALVHGDVAHSRSAPSARGILLDTAALITVTDGGIAPASATHRPARVTVTLRDGSSVVTEVAHPDGDADFTPFDRAAHAALLDDALVGVVSPTASTVVAVVAALPHAERAGDQFALLRSH